MAYLTPQQYLDALTSGMGGRVTAYEDPSQKDPNEILQVTGDWLNRTGAPNLSARASTYRGGSGGGPTNLQRGMDGFGFEPAPQMWDSPPPGAARRSPATTPPSGVGVPYGQPVLSGLQQLEKAGIARRPQMGDGPEGLMSKIGGFLREPGVSDAIGSFGGEMARTASQPGASFWTSLATGGDAARESLARSREEERLEADRAILADERAREAKVREDLQAALTTMAETGELTPDQIQVSLGLGSSDPAAGMAAIREFQTENTTTTFVDSFLADLPPDVLEKLEASGQADLLRASSSVFSNDQKLDLMMTHGSEITRQENAIDSLLWKLHNIDDRSLATEEQLEQAKFISRNAEYTELMLRSPLNWQVIDLGDRVEYWRDDKLIKTMDKAVDDPVVAPAVMQGFEEFYNLEDKTRSELYQWKRGLDAIERIPDDAFGEKTGALRTAWQAFQKHISDGGDRGAGLAVLEGSWAALGFANLSSFVGPTSDYEFGIAQDLSGTMDLTKEDLKKHMLQLYRQRLDRIAEHNDRLLRRVPEEELRELLIIRLSPEDFYTPTRKYYNDRLGSNLSSPGHREMLSGVRSWTGALQELGPEDVPKPATINGVGPTSVTPGATPDSLQATFDSLQAVTEPDSTTVNRRFLYPDSTTVNGLLGVDNPEKLPQRTATGELIPSGSTWTYSGQERGVGPFKTYRWELRDPFYKLIEFEWRDSPE